MERTFIIRDKSGRGVAPFMTTESHIRKYWPLFETDYNGKKLIDFLEDCEKGDSWKTNSEEIMYLNFVVN